MSGRDVVALQGGPRWVNDMLQENLRIPCLWGELSGPPTARRRRRASATLVCYGLRMGGGVRRAAGNRF